jgi:transaldolase
MSATPTADVNPNLRRLAEAGSSPWLDLLRRSLVTRGELARMVAEDSVRGVTANPSIFEKAILGSQDYDADLAEMAREELSAQEIYERLAVKDVQLACDVLRGAWEAEHHDDGFASLEVAPEIAHDSALSLDAARDFWQRVSRPNLMIKIPGTKEGVDAIEEATYEGININVTLLFGVEPYERVAEAYLRGLERRLAEGKTLDVRSVASFFVSRVDTLVDKQLEETGRDDLLGKAAIANARLAYRSFERIFSGPRWDALHHAGAHVQRPLWASTGVKNPRYPDTMYVDELVGPHTVSTMPLQTLMAVADHGHVRGPTAQHDPDADLRALADAGIDLDRVTDQLLIDGLLLFEGAMKRLLGGIEERRQAVITGRPPTIVAVMGYLAPTPELDGAIAELRDTIREQTRAAVTYGYGPRFLHSTGQLHKGGPPTGRFLQLVDEPSSDIPIPGSDYTFATLIAAQSAGDMQTLRAHGLPVERVRLDGDPAGAVRELARRIRVLAQGA